MNSKTKIIFFSIAAFFVESGQEIVAQDTPPYLNPDRSIDERVDDLVQRMTLEEKVSQIIFDNQER